MIQGIRQGRMTHCHYQGKPTVVPSHACYRYCYILHLTGLLTRSTYILTKPQGQIDVQSSKCLGKDLFPTLGTQRLRYKFKDSLGDTGYATANTGNLLRVLSFDIMSILHKYSTQPAAHSQDTNTGRSKGGRW